MKKISKKMKRISALLLALLLVITSLNINVRSVRAAEEDPYKEERALYKLIGIDLEYEENVSLDEQLDEFLGDARKMEELVGTFILYTMEDTELSDSTVFGRAFIGGKLTGRDENDTTRNYDVTGGKYNGEDFGYAAGIVAGGIETWDTGFQPGGRKFLMNLDTLNPPLTWEGEDCNYKYKSTFGEHYTDVSFSELDIDTIIAKMNETLENISSNMSKLVNSTIKVTPNTNPADFATDLDFSSGEPQVIVFNCTLDEFEALKGSNVWINWKELKDANGNNLPVGSRILFNISGTNIEANAGTDDIYNFKVGTLNVNAGGPGRMNFMFHFPDIEEFSVSNEFDGHLFAPKATVYRQGGKADVMSMIVKSMRGVFTIGIKENVDGVDFNRFKIPVVVTGEATIENGSGSIAIKVTGQDGGVPTGDVTVTYTDSDGSDKTFTNELESDGTTTITLTPEEVALLPEEPVFTITYLGDDKYDEGTGTAEVDDNRTPELIETEITVKVEEKADGTIVIKGQLTEEDGTPIVGEDVTVTYTGTDGTEKTVTVETDADGNYTVPANDFKRGVENTVTAEFGGSDVYNGSEATITETVNEIEVEEPVNTEITVDVVENADGTIVITGELTTEADGTPIGGEDVTITYTGTDGTEKTVTVETDADGNYTVPADDFKRGVENEVTAEFDGNDVYNGSKDTLTGTVKEDTTITVDVVENADRTIVITGQLTEEDGTPIGDAAVTITYTGTDGTKKTVPATTDEDGNYTVPANDFKRGVENEVTAEFDGTKNYNESDASKTETIAKIDVDISGTVVIEDDSASIAIQVTGEDGGAPTGSVTVTYVDTNGETQELTGTLEEGKVTIAIEPEDIPNIPENPVFTITYPSDDKYAEGSEVLIKEEGEVVDNRTVKEETTITVDVVENADRTIVIKGQLTENDGTPIGDAAVTITYTGTDGTKKTVPATTDEDGNYTVPANDFKRGVENEVTAEFDGTKNYNESDASTTETIAKIDVDISGTVVIEDDSASIAIQVTGKDGGAPTGSVTVTYVDTNGETQELTGTLEEGKVTIAIEPEDIPNIPENPVFTITYPSDDKYAEGSEVLIKEEGEVVDNRTVKEETTITVDVVENADRTIVITGQLTEEDGTPIGDAAVTITYTGTDGTKKTVPATTDEDGNYTVPANDFKRGVENEVTAEFDGTKNYNESDASTTETIAKIDVDISGTVVIEDDSASIAIQVTGEDGGAPTGSVTVTYVDTNGETQELTGTLEEGKVTIAIEPEEIPNIPENPVFTITYPSDDKYAEGSEVLIKEEGEVVDNRTVKEETTITVDVVENADRTIVIKGQLTENDGTPIGDAAVTITYTGTDGTKKTVPATTDADGNYTVPANDFKRGVENEVTAEFDGTKNYNESDASTTETIAKIDVDISGTVVIEDDSASIAIQVTGQDGGAPTGSVTVTYVDTNGETQELTGTLEEGKVTIAIEPEEIPNIPENPEFTITYPSDDKYAEGSEVLIKEEGEVVDNRTVKEETTITVDVVENADRTIVITGQLTENDGTPIGDAAVEITYTGTDGTKKTVPATTDADGNYTVPANDFKRGVENEVTAEFDGTKNYNESDASTTETIAKIDVDISGTVVIEDDSASIAIQVTGEDGGAPTGSVTVTYVDTNGETQELTGTLEEGKVTIAIEPEEIPNIPENPEFTITYPSDDKYAEGSEVLIKEEGEVVDNRTVKEETTITVDVVENADRTIVITGQLTENDGTPIGDAAVTITYTGTDGTKKTVPATTDADGNYTVPANDFKRGVENEVTAEFEGSDVYNGSEATITETVNEIEVEEPVNTTITVDVVENADGTIVIKGQLTENDGVMVIGDAAVEITYTGTDGTEKTVPVTTDADGNYTVPADDFKRDVENEVTAEFDATECYNGSVATTKKKIAKKLSEIEGIGQQDGNDISVIFTVIVSNDDKKPIYPGTIEVTFTKNGEEVKETLTLDKDGKAKIEGLKASDFKIGEELTFYAHFAENESYYGSNGSAFVVVVDHIAIPEPGKDDVEIIVDTTKDGDKVIVEIEVKGEDGKDTPTGSVDVTYTDKDGEEITETVDLDENGKGTLEVDIDKLPEGEVEFEVTYPGDENYNDGEGKADDSNEKRDVEIITTITDKEDSTIIDVLVKDPDGKGIPSGTVTVTFDDKAYDIVIDEEGKGQVIIPKKDLSETDKTDVTVSYGGDDAYNKGSKELELAVAPPAGAIQLVIFGGCIMVALFVAMYTMKRREEDEE